MTKIKLKNGEIIDLSAGRTVKKDDKKVPSSKKKSYTQRVEARSVKTEERIKGRGKIQDDIGKLIGKDSAVIDRIAGGLNLLATPTRSLEAAASNPLLIAQKGELDTNQLTKEAIKRFIPVPILAALQQSTETPAGDRLAEAVASGATLQRQGQYGDVLKNAGVPEGLADATGLFLNIAGPIKIFKGINSVYGKFAKMSDKTMMQAGNNLIGGVNASRKAMGVKVGEAYASVDDAFVNSADFIDDIASMPKALVKAFKKEFGDISAYAKDLTVKKTVLVKRWLGKFRKGQWGKAERGLQESLDEADIGKAYGGLKKIIHKGIKGTKDTAYADMVSGLESSFSNTDKAGRFIKNAVVNGKLNLPTKVGQFAKATRSVTDSSARTAMDIIRKSSKKAGQYMVKAMRTMSKFNRTQAIKKGIEKTAGAAILGGAVGAIGGGVVSKYSNKE